MAEVEEKQTEATEQPEKESAKEKKPKKSRKTKDAEESSGEEKPKKHRPRNMDNPKIHDMIIESLDVLDERKGVTLYAIKRYLEDNYKVDMTKVAAHVRKVLKNGVENGDIIRTRGVGAMGRFKVKHTKPTMIKKRQAPEDYQELPSTTKPRVVKPKKETPSKQKVTASKKAGLPKTKSPKAKKGRSGKKK